MNIAKGYVNTCNIFNITKWTCTETHPLYNFHGSVQFLIQFIIILNSFSNRIKPGAACVAENFLGCGKKLRVYIETNFMNDIEKKQTCWR